MLILMHMTGTVVRYCSWSVPHGKSVGKRVGDAVGELVGRLVGTAVGGDDVDEADGGTVGEDQLNRTMPVWY